MRSETVVSTSSHSALGAKELWERPDDLPVERQELVERAWLAAADDSIFR